MKSYRRKKKTKIQLLASNENDSYLWIIVSRGGEWPNEIKLKVVASREGGAYKDNLGKYSEIKTSTLNRCCHPAKQRDILKMKHWVGYYHPMHKHRIKQPK